LLAPWLLADNALEQQGTDFMQPRISVITLGVADMEQATRFYRDGLGLPIRDDKPPVIYFQLHGTWLALFPRQALASYANIPPDGQGFSGVTLSCNVASKEEVELTHPTQSAGAATPPGSPTPTATYGKSSGTPTPSCNDHGDHGAGVDLIALARAIRSTPAPIWAPICHSPHRTATSISTPT
jgi:catechol 2,3-dioxygenase-like lactoylglutathione lyase family enzyme